MRKQLYWECTSHANVTFITSPAPNYYCSTRLPNSKCSHGWQLATAATAANIQNRKFRSHIENNNNMWFYYSRQKPETSRQIAQLTYLIWQRIQIPSWMTINAPLCGEFVAYERYSDTGNVQNRRLNVYIVWYGEKPIRARLFTHKCCFYSVLARSQIKRYFVVVIFWVFLFLSLYFSYHVSQRRTKLRWTLNSVAAAVAVAAASLLVFILNVALYQ